MKTKQVKLQIVTDEIDLLRMFALRIIYALNKIFSDYTVDIKRASDVVVCPQEINYTCKRIVFITWGLDRCTGSRISKWLNMLKPDQKRDRFLLIMTEDLDGTQLEVTDTYKKEFESENQVKVSHIKCIEHWWPSMVRFLFSIATPRTGRYGCYIRSLQGNKHTLVNIEDIVRTCLSYFNVSVKSNQVSTGSGCNVLIVSDAFPTDPESTSDNNVYLSNYLKAKEARDNQYNREHILAGILSIYTCTRVVKPPFSCLKLATKPVVAILDFFGKRVDVQCTFTILSLILCTLGTGLPFWRSVTLPIGRYRYDNKTVIGLFQVCFSDRYSFSLVVNCGPSPIDMPPWLVFFTGLCLLTIVMYLMAMSLIISKLCDCTNKPRLTKVATACHLTAGLLCGLVILFWVMKSEDYVASLKLGDATSNVLSASFYLFCVSAIFMVLWITFSIIVNAS